MRSCVVNVNSIISQFLVQLFSCIFSISSLEKVLSPFLVFFVYSNVITLNIRRIVLDVMKPLEPDIVVYAEALNEVKTVNSVNIALIEVDRAVENIKITLEGDELDYESIKNSLSELAGAIHSIDMVVAGQDLIESSNTPQDD